MKRAGRAVGDGVARLVRTHRGDYQLVLFIGLLVLIGLTVLFAISPYQIELINAGGGNLDQGHYMLKQLAYLFAGSVAFVVAASIPVRIWQKYAAKLLLFALLLCALLFVLGLGNIAPAFCHNGACRWYNIGFATFQPAELTKFAVLIFLASFLGKRIARDRLSSVGDTLLPVGIVLAVVSFFIIGLQKDMGTGLTVIGAVTAMLVVGGLHRRLLLLLGGGMVAAGVLFIIFSPHRIARVLTLVNSSGVSDSASYHIDMATVAIGSGGFFGRGLGNGVQAFGYLPEALNDSIFAVLGETFGFLGLVVILGIFFALLRRVVRVSRQVEDPVMQMLAAGVFGWLASHIIINVGAMIGILPLTGVTLPFLSFGGTSLLFMMAALGLVFQISRYTTHRTLTTGGQHETTDSRRRVGRTRHAGARHYQRA